MGLAIAGSMPVVKEKGLTASAWEQLSVLLENGPEMMRATGDQFMSLNMVVFDSFNALSARKQEELLRMAVLAPGAVAPIDMLHNLWETEVCCGRAFFGGFMALLDAWAHAHVFESVARLL